MKILRMLLGAVFAIAGGLKLNHTLTLAQDIFEYQLFPLEMIGLVAVLLPWLELISGTALLLGIWTQSNALTLGLLSLAQSFVVASALWRHLDIRCGCFHGATHASYGHLAINVVLMALGIIIARGAGRISSK